ncbi:MAG: O-antigen ligase family protein [Enterobacteriaceae bacterium]|nr:O-antigen ligase family protein [Enterobacteriaceae bacterium]
MMKIKLKTDNIKKYLIILCIMFIMISISAILVNERIARIAFFTASYISIAGILIDKNNYKSYIKLVPVSLLIFGLSKAIWFYFFRISYNVVSEIDMYSGYIQSGKRIILCSILISYLLINIKNLSHNKKLISASLIVSFIVGTFFSVHQIEAGVSRVGLYTVATSAAYMYSCLSLVLISFLISSGIKNIYSYPISMIIFLISMFVIIHTGTRAVMIFHPLLVFIILLFTNWHNKYKTALLLSALVITISTSYFFNGMIIKKINQTKAEVSIYEKSKGNQPSSLGARFSMWNTGLYSFFQHPMGTTMKERNKTIEEYTRNKNKDKSALEFTYTHLHNEIIDTLSLQGILGVLALLFFYCAMLIKSIKEKNPMLLSVMLCLIAYGLTDVIFINRAMSLLFCLMIIVSLLLNKQIVSGKKLSN